jgi:CDP-diacylglycerol--glycerol-3-phosphate 3-phosphatidyltransferase
MTSARPAGSVPAWLPNALTVARLVLVPAFVVLLFLHPGDVAWRVAAAALFTVAILTDLFDGRLARKYDLVSDFGKLWDPIADKALTGAAFVSLSILGELPWWITIAILVREWGITWMRVRMLKYEVMAAAPGGKLKTVLQSVALIGFLAYPIEFARQAAPWWFWPAWTVMAAAFVLTMVTGVQYVADAWRLRAKALESKDDDR